MVMIGFSIQFWSIHMSLSMDVEAMLEATGLVMFMTVLMC